MFVCMYVYTYAKVVQKCYNYTVRTVCTVQYCNTCTDNIVMVRYLRECLFVQTLKMVNTL